jgi:hypothetical protein
MQNFVAIATIADIEQCRTIEYAPSKVQRYNALLARYLDLSCFYRVEGDKVSLFLTSHIGFTRRIARCHRFAPRNDETMSGLGFLKWHLATFQ